MGVGGTCAPRGAGPEGPGRRGAPRTMGRDRRQDPARRLPADHPVSRRETLCQVAMIEPYTVHTFNLFSVVALSNP
jgi:hypothetical protein